MVYPRFIYILLIAFSTLLFAADETVTEAKFKVSGICGMCKTRIENSLKIKEVKYAKWNKETKLLKVFYFSDAITVDSLMQRVASVGHDTEKFKAEQAAYESLHKCCLYREQAAH